MTLLGMRFIRYVIVRKSSPTVGSVASGGRNRTDSAFGGVGDTIVVGRVLYAGNFPIVRTSV
jgi:hypothetical protein